MIYFLLFFHSFSRDTRRNKIILPKYNRADKYIALNTSVGGLGQAVRKNA